MWEHDVIMLDSNIDTQKEFLDQQSRNGWELVSVAVTSAYQIFAYFKRRKPL